MWAVVTSRSISSVAYRVDYSPAALAHLRGLTRPQQVAILEGVDEHLAHQPDTETRNRKPMRPNPLAPWELRLGDLRVYYEVEHSPDAVVTVLAVGIKVRNVVFIGNEAIDL